MEDTKDNKDYLSNGDIVMCNGKMARVMSVEGDEASIYFFDKPTVLNPNRQQLRKISELDKMTSVTVDGKTCFVSSKEYRDYGKGTAKG